MKSPNGSIILTKMLKLSRFFWFFESGLKNTRFFFRSCQRHPSEESPVFCRVKDKGWGECMFGTFHSAPFFFSFAKTEERSFCLVETEFKKWIVNLQVYFVQLGIEGKPDRLQRSECVLMAGWGCCALPVTRQVLGSILWGVGLGPLYGGFGVGGGWGKGGFSLHRPRCVVVPSTPKSR